MTEHPSGSDGAKFQGDSALDTLTNALREKLSGPTPARAKCQNARGKTYRKKLKTKESITSWNKASLEALKLKLSEPAAEDDADEAEPPLIISIDAEWVEEPEPPKPDPAEEDGDDDDPGPDPVPPGNIILSYQYACRFILGPGEEAAPECDWSGIIYTRHAQALLNPSLSEVELAKFPVRIGFTELIGHAISRGIATGKLRKWPKQVITAAHWTRADLASMADYAEIKNQFDSVRKTYVSLQPFKAEFAQANRHVRKFDVRLMDTNLLSPGPNTRLEVLGDRYGLPKLDTGFTEVDGARVPYKTRMDLYLVDHPKKYEAYAIRDAEISALHIQWMAKFVCDDLGLNSANFSHTLGSTAVKFLLKQWEDQGISRGEVNGFVTMKGKKFNARTRQYVTVKWEEPNKNVQIHREIAELSFYGGRNETFWFGATPKSHFHEFDLAGAYTTALSSLKILDYEQARPTNDPYDFSVDEVGFARIRFRFRDDCRYPCLPVMAADQRGLIYPLRGETCATAPEIALALGLGADVEVLYGVVIPWKANSAKPFEAVISELTSRRRQHPDGSIQNAMYKELGNTLYGKTVQGVRGKRTYNTRTDKHEEIGKSPLTNVFLGAHVTGLVRALLSELLAAIPPGYIIVSATTDSIITNCPLAKIPMDGPVARHMGRVRARLADLDDSGRTKPDLLDVKSHTRQLLSWRTRAIATLEPAPDGKLKLARGGVKTPEGVFGIVAENAWLAREVLTSPAGSKVKSKEPLPFTQAHRAARDHRFQEVEKTANYEYDHKRRIITPGSLEVEVPGEPGRTIEHLAADTVPWTTVTEFDANRELFEQWRFSGEGRRLKTLEDWGEWQQFLAGTTASRAGVRRSKYGIAQQALRIFFRAFFWQRWGLRREKGKEFRWAAQQLTSAGFPVKEQDMKNAGRSYDRNIPEHTIPADAPGVRELVLALVAIWPSFDWKRLVLDPPLGWLEGREEPEEPAQEIWQVVPATARPHLVEPARVPLRHVSHLAPNRGLYDRRAL